MSDHLPDEIIDLLINEVVDLNTADQRHLENCEVCQKDLLSLKALKLSAQKLDSANSKLDQKIYAALEEQFRQPQKQFALWKGAAALMICGLGVFLFQLTKNQSPVTIINGDLNNNGRLEMLDAYYLKRQISKGNIKNTKWDFNKDGAVDNDDVEWLANQSVSLRKASNG